jgi:hypothetical protein
LHFLAETAPCPFDILAETLRLKTFSDGKYIKMHQCLGELWTAVPRDFRFDTAFAKIAK